MAGNFKYEDWQKDKIKMLSNEYGDYRYMLSVPVNPNKSDRQLIVVGINPSTADACSPDNTIEEVIKLAKANEYDGFIMVNVYPQRAKKAAYLPSDGEEEQTEVDYNIHIIYNVLKNLSAPDILLAYGDDIEDRKYFIPCLKRFIDKLSGLRPHYKIIAQTDEGHPYHPSGARRSSWRPNFKATPLGDSFKIYDFTDADLNDYLAGL